MGNSQNNPGLQDGLNPDSNYVPFQGDEQEDLPPMQAIPYLDLPCHIHPSSIKLESLGGHLYQVKFQLDSTSEATLTVRHGAVLSSDGSLSQLDSRFPAPSVFIIKEGVSQTSPEIILDTSLFSPAELAFTDKRLVPVVLEMEAQRFTTLLHLAFRQTSNGLNTKVIKHQVFVNDTYFDIKEVFGTPWARGPEEEHKECSVCLENRSDTVVFPCCHLCLCANCGNFLRTQVTKKCPICRSEVSALIQITDD